MIYTASQSFNWCESHNSDDKLHTFYCGIFGSDANFGSMALSYKYQAYFSSKKY